MTIITLIRPHFHRGQSYPAGARIEVSAPDAAWIVKSGVGVPDSTPARSVKPTRKTRSSKNG